MKLLEFFALVTLLLVRLPEITDAYSRSMFHIPWTFSGLAGYHSLVRKLSTKI